MSPAALSACFASGPGHLNMMVQGPNSHLWVQHLGANTFFGGELHPLCELHTEHAGASLPSEAEERAAGVLDRRPWTSHA